MMPMPDPPWWDKIVPLIVIIRLMYLAIPIVVLVLAVSIHKNVKRILENLPENEKDKA